MRFIYAVCLGLLLVGASTASNYRWVPTDDKEQIALYDGDVQVGVYHLKNGYYRPLEANGQFGEKRTTPPSEVPKKYLQDLLPLPRENFGVDFTKRSAKEEYSVNGMALTKESALRMLSASIPTDSEFLRLTIIGQESARKQVRKDFETLPEFMEIRTRCVVHDYPPAHWAVRDCGFECGGSPTIYLQDFTGKVLHRQDDYSDGGAGLAAALRKADPFYKKTNDVDFRKLLGEPWVLLLATVASTLVFIVVSTRRGD